MLLLNFTGLGTFPDKERTQAKTALFCLYLTELDLELAIRGDGRQSERGAAAAVCTFLQVGALCQNFFHRKQRGTSLVTVQHPLASACKPASPTSDNKGNQMLALPRDNLCDSFMWNSNPTHRSCFFISLLPSPHHPDLPLHSPAD